MSHTVTNVIEKLRTLPAIPDFIILGEMHGAKQNAVLIQEFAEHLLGIDNGNPLTLAFEWVLTEMEITELREYLKGGQVPKKLPEFFLHSDGRFTYEHTLLLNWIRNHNLHQKCTIDIHTFDEENTTFSDESMARSLSRYKETHPESIILVETGNMHARKFKYPFENTQQTPLASILKENKTVFSVFCVYKEGYINMEGVPRDVTQAMSQVEGPGVYFDAIIDIPFSAASENIKDLTSISRMLVS
ncbi:hypothetical protein KGM48_02550 [Patescibacteria group bacterium]|nr:hypothetical protein [Patescibacteria group bacterium]